MRKTSSLPDDPAAILAVVGRTHILLGDVCPSREAESMKCSPRPIRRFTRGQLHFARLNLVRGLLAQAIQNKMMRESFLMDQVGTEAADKHEEADAKLTSQARQMFFESEIPELKKQYKVRGPHAARQRTPKERKLVGGTSTRFRRRDAWSSLHPQQGRSENRMFRSPKSLSTIKPTMEEYERPTRARWEQMSVLFGSLNRVSWPTKRSGTWDVKLTSAATCRRSPGSKSQEPFASKGGLHEWTTKGSLASENSTSKFSRFP